MTYAEDLQLVLVVKLLKYEKRILCVFLNGREVRRPRLKPFFSHY